MLTHCKVNSGLNRKSDHPLKLNPLLLKVDPAGLIWLNLEFVLKRTCGP